MAQNTSYIACWLNDEYTEDFKLIKQVYGLEKNSDIIRLMIRFQLAEIRKNAGNVHALPLADKSIAA